MIKGIPAQQSNLHQAVRTSISLSRAGPEQDELLCAPDPSGPQEPLLTTGLDDMQQPPDPSLKPGDSSLLAMASQAALAALGTTGR